LLGLPQAAPSAEFTEPVAIVGARIEIGDGRVIEKGTVLVEDGRIKAVGETVTVPNYAWTIKGEGLTVYPGFIDAAANAPLTVPEADPNQDAAPSESEFAPPFMRTANRRGIRPELDAALAYTPTPTVLLPERKAGFANLHVIPTGGILNGRGAVVNLGGRAKRDSVVRADVSLGAGFRRPPGSGYPGSLLGIQAQLRQAMLDGAWAASMPASERPTDPVLNALVQAKTARTPFFFEADNENEIRRALTAGKEFDLPVTLVGAAEAYKSAPQLAAAKVPVVASVAFGPEPRLPSDAPAAVREDREKSYRERSANLAALEKAGVRFALTGRGTQNRDAFWRGLRQANTAGLSKNRALQALTLDAARILGVEKDLGSIEVGKLGNLTITRGDFLAQNVVVRYVIVGGDLFRPDRDRLPAAPGGRGAADPDDDGHNHMDGDDLCEPQVKRGGGR
jgi:imidazolonepropionase-like amidohydrolase